jgi:predicted transcriptional regulator of viral defense system
MSAPVGTVPTVCASRETKRRGLRTSPDVSYHMAMAAVRRDDVIDLIRSAGIVRRAELEALGVSPSWLYRLVREGRVVRLDRGLYVATGHELSAEHALSLVAKRVPAGIVCLLTALRFHGLTTQAPAEVWIALPEKARRPRLAYPRLRVARFSGAALTEGVDTHRIEGVDVRVYSAAKTVADCFKYRNKIGVDVAVEALRDFGESYRGRATELAHYARICRVTRVMQPYLDAIP